jgi:hypothetical protein
MDTIQQPTNELGPIISKHKFSFIQKWGKLLGGIVMICLGPVIYFSLNILWARAGSAMEDLLATTPFLRYLPLILGSVFPLMGIFTLFQVRSNWLLAVTLYEGGIEYTDNHGSRKYAWDVIEGLYLHIVRYYYYAIIPTGTAYQATVQLRGGETLILDNRLSKIKQLCERFDERLAAVQMPKYLDKIQTGQRVEFGALSIDQGGIYQQNKALKWAEVGKVTLEEGMLSISKQGKWGNWAKFRFSEIPNAALFYPLAQELKTAE